MAFSLPLFISVWDPDSQDSDATFLVGLLSLSLASLAVLSVTVRLVSNFIWG